MGSGSEIARSTYDLSIYRSKSMTSKCCVYVNSIGLAYTLILSPRLVSASQHFLQRQLLWLQPRRFLSQLARLV
jgi:hypothetical protein